MPSLYERLNSVNPLAKKPEPAAVSQDCLVLETLVDLEPKGINAFPGELMSDLSKGAIKDAFEPEDFLFFDTETTGLSRGAGTVAFLVGYGRFEKGKLKVTQILMRDYPQETQLLDDFIRRVTDSRCLVSYNGLTFDIPVLQSRLTMNRKRFDLNDFPHLDLLHLSRRVFKLRLGRVPLTRLEEAVFGLVRENDLPGALVPAKYFEYLEKRDEVLLKDILEHNCQDIISLARLYLHIADLYREPLIAGDHQDLYSIGKSFEGMGDSKRALLCYKACSDKTVRDLARFRMSEIYRREGSLQEAVSGFESLRLEGALSARLFISLAKIYEHRYREPRRALEIARQGMVYCFERFGENATGNADYLDLERRSRRLERKVENER